MTTQISENPFLFLLPGDALSRLDATPFLTRCREGRAGRAELEKFLLQHFHYSRHFTRYLCALLANMSNETDRRLLMENLFEEMGLGHLGSIPHSQIYRNMLQALGLDPAAAQALPETSALVGTIFSLSTNPDPLVGLGALCLGAEAIVPHIYAQIYNGLLAAGFPKEHLEFFPLHISGDDEHARTMKKIIERELNADPERITVLRQAAEEAIDKRQHFFLALDTAAVETRELRHAL